MKSKSSSRPAEAPHTVDDLLEQRATLESWLARVDDCSTEVEERIAERVRADYEARLETTLEELRMHTESLSRDLENARERLARAEKDAPAASESLQEGGLRYRIGEISEDEWEKRRIPLDNAIKDADDERLAARLEVTRLTEIIEDVGNSPTPSEVPEPELAWLTDSANLSEDAELPTLADDEVTQVQEIIESVGVVDGAESDVNDAEVAADPVKEEEVEENIEEEGKEDVEEEGDELAFLEQLDRVFDDKVTGEESSEAEPEIVLETAEGEPVTDDDVPTEATEPVPGIKCPSCGYTNEATAWYCEVCGVDLD